MGVTWLIASGWISRILPFPVADRPAGFVDEFSHGIRFVEQAQFSLLLAFDPGIREHAALVQDLVDIGNKTAAEAEFVPGLFEMFDPACMGREVVLSQRTGSIDLPVRDPQVPVPQDKFTRFIQHEFVDTLTGGIRQGRQGPVQDIERGKKAGTFVKDIAGTDADDGPDSRGSHR